MRFLLAIVIIAVLLVGVFGYIALAYHLSQVVGKWGTFFIVVIIGTIIAILSEGSRSK